MAKRKTEQNVTNTPEHIAAACRRVLAWVEDKKDRKQIIEHMSRLEKS